VKATQITSRPSGDYFAGGPVSCQAGSPRSSVHPPAARDFGKVVVPDFIAERRIRVTGDFARAGKLRYGEESESLASVWQGNRAGGWRPPQTGFVRTGGFLGPGDTVEGGGPRPLSARACAGSESDGFRRDFDRRGQWTGRPAIAKTLMDWRAGRNWIWPKGFPSTPNRTGQASAMDGARSAPLRPAAQSAEDGRIRLSLASKGDERTEPLGRGRSRRGVSESYSAPPPGRPTPPHPPNPRGLMRTLGQ